MLYRAVFSYPCTFISMHSLLFIAFKHLLSTEVCNVKKPQFSICQIVVFVLVNLFCTIKCAACWQECWLEVWVKLFDGHRRLEISVSPFQASDVWFLEWLLEWFLEWFQSEGQRKIWMLLLHLSFVYFFITPLRMNKSFRACFWIQNKSWLRLKMKCC